MKNLSMSAPLYRRPVLLTLSNGEKVRTHGIWVYGSDPPLFPEGYLEKLGTEDPYGALCQRCEEGYLRQGQVLLWCNPGGAKKVIVTGDPNIVCDDQSGEAELAASINLPGGIDFLCDSGVREAFGRLVQDGWVEAAWAEAVLRVLLNGKQWQPVPDPGEMI